MKNHVSRGFLGGLILLCPILSRAEPAPAVDVIDSIETSVVRSNLDGKSTTWFHPRGGVMPTPSGTVAFLTLQQINGSDYFGTPHWSTSSDLGKTWSDPMPIPGLDRRPVKPGTDIAICDVVPEYHAKTNTVLALGYSCYYRNGAKDAKERPLFPFYFVRGADGSWTAPQRLVWDDPRCADLLSAGCGQRVTVADGNVLIPVSFGSKEKTIRSATTLLCSFDGKSLTVKKAGAELPGKRGRGFIEPSIAVLDGVYYMTIRSEDGKGYVSTSSDGLNWKETTPWAWDDGQPLTMSTTQQHWLTHSQTLYLVYTRKSELNPTVFRWRAPTYLAAVDRSTMRLVRATERIVFPIHGDGVKDGKNVPYSGNFHTMALTKDESLITDCEILPNDGFKWDQIQARIRWKVPNKLAD